MKKLFILLLSIMYGTIGALAAEFDVIIKNNSEKIEAFIQEVSDTEVRYKKHNNPTGPTFVIKVTEISSILYSNGDVQAFAPLSSTIKNVQPSSHTSSTEVLSSTTGSMLRIGDKTYSINGKTLEGKELEYYLNRTCPEAYQHYFKWKAVENIGWTLLAIGPILCLPVGLTMFAYCRYNYNMYVTSACFMALGAAYTVASIPLIACGNGNKKRVNEVYNRYCATSDAANILELKFNASSNGFGLALAF